MITAEAASRVASGAAGGLDQRALIGTMAGQIQTWVNLLAFLLQAFVVSRIFKYMGVRAALFILPVIALGGYAMMAILPVFGIVRWVKILENSTDYSVQNTTRHALFLPTSREAKYKAKQAIDSFFVRAGDMLQAAVVFAGTMLAFGIRSYALVNLALVVVWLRVGGRHRSRAQETRPGRRRREGRLMLGCGADLLAAEARRAEATSARRRSF